jgi:hypothetical protein
MRSQEIGRRYLAGFVIASAVLYVAATGATSAIAWPFTDPWWLSINLVLFGLVPSGAAFILGRKAWSATPARSAALSAVALIILLLGLFIWQTFVVSF